jgi:subtilisin family serine protease
MYNVGVRSGILLTIVLVVVLGLPDSGVRAAERPSDVNMLVAEPVVREKAPRPVSETAQQFLAEQGGERVRVWVYFTDKGVFGKEGFARKASATVLSDKVMARRAKTGTDQVLFIDLPVVDDYLAAVTELGGDLRRVSRWLNAASFEVDADRLDAIGALGHVAQIVPVAGFKKEYAEAVSVRVDEAYDLALSADALEYGIASGQLGQINVPEAHQAGLDGSGVTLAIFDTGYRKSHEAFTNHFTDGRVLAEWDFIFDDDETANEPGDGDWSSQWNHGTLIWSVSAGYLPGQIMGPAYKASFLLAKTEDVRSETPVEEDNWVAAMEWADSLGADVITSSLGYSDWYSYSDFDGLTATTTIAANTATSLGILVCNSMGNSGPGAGTLSAPADAFEILSVGAVNSSGSIASFSSRGPTYDGRMKPEVCAQGVSTQAATASTDVSYGPASGTSLSTPLVAGAACLVIQANPSWPPQLVREALMQTADNAASPNNTYGWGVINTAAAAGYGASISSDTTFGEIPLTINFAGSSPFPISDWYWEFGDGNTSFEQNPTHVYTETGVYDVSLTVTSLVYGSIEATRSDYIIAIADTVSFVSDSAFAGEKVVISVDMVNSQPVEQLVIPFTFGPEVSVQLDSVTRGARTAYFESLSFLGWDPFNRRYVVSLVADNGGGADPLAEGSGEVMRIWFGIDALELGGITTAMTTFNGTHTLKAMTNGKEYPPAVMAGSVGTRYVLRGDLNHDYMVNVSDMTYLISHLFSGGPAPVTVQAGDVNNDQEINVQDMTYLIAYLFSGGPAPVTP